MRFIISIAILLPLLVQGQQNLVPNPSFEEHSECPTSSAMLQVAVPWTNTGFILDSPDYFHECAPPVVVSPEHTSPSVGVPENVAGFQFARTGLAYAGFYAFSGSWEPNGREYVQVQLTEPIHAGVRYEVSFHVSLADKWWFGVGSLGAYFSTEQLVRTHYNEIPDVEPQIQSPEGFVFTDKEGWTEVRDTFNSRYGGEEYLIIGNFRPDSESNITFVDSGATLGHQASYYFIDDVSVIALDSIPNSIEEQNKLHFSVSPNPATDMIRIETPQLLRRVRLLDMLGREVYSEDVVGSAHTINLSGIPSGLYLIEAQDNEGRRAVERVVKAAQQ